MMARDSRMVPLVASLLVTLVTTLVPSDYGTPMGLLTLLGVLAWVCVTLVEDLSARLGLRWPAIYACLGTFHGEVTERAYGSVEEALALVALQVTIRWSCDAITDERIEDECLYDHDDEEGDDDGHR